jgi:hypothetical protein
LHFCRFTDTPAIGLWTYHFCSHYALPRNKTVNIAPASKNDWTRYRRIAFNIVENPGDRLCGDFIAEQAALMLGPRSYLNEPAPDCVLRSLVEKCRQFDSPMTTFVDRHKSFDVMLRHLRRYERPIMVTTGCIRAEEDWSAGFSDYIFGLFFANHGGKLHSVDLNAGCVSFARPWCKGYGDAVELHQSHSHEWLKAYSGPKLDLFYSDSQDVGTKGYQECALEEARLALPHLADHALIAFDDSPWSCGKFQGKGALAIPWLLERGWKVVYGGYQVVLGR